MAKTLLFVVRVWDAKDVSEDLMVDDGPPPPLPDEDAASELEEPTPEELPADESVPVDDAAEAESAPANADDAAESAAPSADTDEAKELDLMDIEREIAMQG